MSIMRDCKNNRCVYHDESFSGCSCERIEIGDKGQCLDCYVKNEVDVSEEDGSEE